MRHAKRTFIALIVNFVCWQPALSKSYSQFTQGDCSPAIIAQGDVSVSCGISKKALKRLQQSVDQQAKKNTGQDVTLAMLVKDLQEIKENLAKRDDDIAKQAQVKLDDGDFEAAKHLFERSFQQHAENTKNQQKQQAADAFALANISTLQLNYPEAKRYYQQAVQLDPENALHLNRLGLHLYTMGEYAQAEPLFQRSLAIREKALGKEHPDVATSLNNLAELYRTQGQYAKAEPLYQRSLAIREKALGKEHPDVAESLNNLAGLYDTQGQYAKAESLHHRSLATDEKVLGKEHPAVATDLNNLAELYRTQGQYAKAEPLYQRSLANMEKALGKDHPDVAKILNNLALLYDAQGQYAQAEPLYQRSLAIKEKALGKEHQSVAISLSGLALFYVAQGQYTQALPLLQRSSSIMEKALGKEHPNTKTVRANLQALQARVKH